MSPTPKVIVALPFLWAYEVSCRARTGSVLHKVSLHERLVIRPVFRISETMVPPRHLPCASDFGRHLVVNREDVTPVDPAYQPLRKPAQDSINRLRARSDGALDPSLPVAAPHG